jgi:putative membrane-bound dehydrogenase-like protein
MEAAMRRVLILVTALLPVCVALAQQPPELPQKGAGPGKPLDAKEAQRLFKIDDGLRIELVACEPQIESPVAMQFDPDGRLWVVEMRDYPNGPAMGEKPGGRIRILEDKDGDGFFETSTIWADNLLFANGLLLWKDGAIVTMAPTITHLRDSKGAGRADKEEILYTGFAEQNPQLRVSHPILGLDGWIYCANGLRGGQIRAGDGNQIARQTIDISGMDFRFDPLDHGMKYEAITGPGQYGNTFDEWGNRFVCDNRHHLRHVVMEQRYVKRNPYLVAPSLLQDVSVLEDGPLSSGGKVYPLSKNWTTSSLHEGRFTAACGVFIYHGNALGKLYHGAAFTCEPTGNLVHMEILTPKGATFEARPHKKGVEFLATTDDWFRPVFMTHGPEGAMYVVDMYRTVIEHPEFMPPELKNRPDLSAGRDKGRIWRIVPKDHKTKTPRPGLSKASIAELVKTLEHVEPWWRQTAQRLLLERNDKAMIEPLTKLFNETKSPHAKILTLWLLDRMNALREDDLVYAIHGGDPHVREHAVLISEPRLEKSNSLRVCVNQSLAAMQYPRPLFQTVLTVGGLDDRLAAWRLPLVVQSYGPQMDRWTRLAVQTAKEDHLAECLAASVRGKQVNTDLVGELAATIAARKESKAFRQAFALVVSSKAKWPGLAGLAEGLERRGMTLATVAVEFGEKATYEKQLETIFAEANAGMTHSKEPIEHRLIMLRIVKHAPWLTAKKTFLPIIEVDASPELRIAALRALAAQQDKEVPELLMKLWPGAAPSMRREILEAMLRQPARVHVLLDEIESKRMKASELDPLRTKQLSNHKDAAIRERATKLLAANLPADRKKVLTEYQASLKLKGDAKNGKAIFQKNCATCHRVAGIGVDVGPDIADTRTKTLEALLNDILVPNAAIDANYVNYVISTKDGRILTGMLAVETASSITIKRAENQTDSVLRKDIDEIASTGISLMPDGLEKNINVQEMADLLSFLKNWRYLDGSVPLK